MSTASTSGSTAGLVLHHRYRLDAPLPAKAQAEVWSGHDLVLKRPVAIKILRQDLAADPNIAERFRREAITAARLSHPNIVPTYDTGVDGESTFVVSGLVHGPSLNELLDGNTVPLNVALVITRQISDAISYAHSAGIIHRGLDAGTVFVVGDDMRVLVTDFGLARATTEDEDSDDEALGDIVAIGALLEQMLGMDQGAAADIVTKAKNGTFETAGDLVEAVAALESSLRPRENRKEAQKLPPPKAPRPRQAVQPPPEEEVTAPHQAFDTGQMPFVPAQGSTDGQATGQQDGQTQQQAQSEPQSQNIPVDDGRQFMRYASIAVAVVLILIAIGLGVFVNLAGKSNKSVTVTTQATTPLQITSASAFDPNPGDGNENDAQLANLIDDNLTTTWSTSTYATRTFGNLKTGVGVVLSVNNSEALKTLTVTSAGNGWAAQIYASNSSPSVLTGWGTFIDNQSGLGPQAKFDLHSTTSKNILLWITDLGDTNRLTISNISVGA